MTREARANGEPLMVRWAQTDDADLNDRWRPRANVAAKWLAKAQSVADLGCGSMVLQRSLRPGQVYLPVDVVRRDERTLVLDLNCVSDLARLPTAEASALLGVLEYCYDVGALTAALRGKYQQVVATFNFRRPVESPEDRLAHGWVNHFDQTELQAIFSSHGFRVARASRFKGPREEWMFDFRQRPS